ncbi:D-2-hydroxyacid dehydrogenase [Modestobacter sp. VKM Ac-2985]|uniref:D-2-hydroxyacid dehydrogenase n=1 Tax=Modestobacter sp. VKM Ac-2985 TaxID=3004139 RepID=UPI0022ABAA24|nr:D-2-hydroxyacid dehydrogenase [Modestobacter sp. VKM Ac-2985]MCZ2840151.1 D-2-hydroxyacid dehydrogenase [Modestobacter sp. VKM Ac-2985]
MDAGPGPRDIRTVLATVFFQPDEVEQLRRAFAPAEFLHLSPGDTEGIARALEKADVAVLWGDLDERHLAAPELRWVHCDHAGLTRSARPEVFEKGLVVTGSAGRSAPALAQHAFYFALALSFDARGLLEMQSTRQWRGPVGYENRLALYGKTLGIVGFGKTGRAMALLGKAFGMRVIAYRRRADEDAPGVDRLLATDAGDTLDPLLEESDVIMLAAHLSDETHHLFSTEQFERMKSSAYLINLARGGIVDQDALVAALHSGAIAGAGLDVADPEPLPPESSLWDAPNVLLTPHMTPRLPDRTARSIEVIVENIRRYRSGEPLLNALTPRDVYTPR